MLNFLQKFKVSPEVKTRENGVKVNFEGKLVEEFPFIRNFEREMKE